MSIKVTTDTFISKAKKIHKETYTYEEVNYTSAITCVTIRCKVHGLFQQSPNNHLSGRGCAECGKDIVRKCRLMTTDDFIKKALHIHSAKYDYSNVKYKSAKANVVIGCLTHGDFIQSATNHLSGKGCPCCGKYGYRVNIPGRLYVLKSGDITKVGITNSESGLRLRQINNSSGLAFTEIFSLWFDNGYLPLNTETKVLQYLKSKYRPVSLVFDGSTECFISVNHEDLLASIAKNSGH